MISGTYLVGFVLMLAWCLYCEIKDGQRSWRRDLQQAIYITIVALLWPLVLIAGIAVGVLLIQADKGKLG